MMLNRTQPCGGHENKKNNLIWSCLNILVMDMWMPTHDLYLLAQRNAMWTWTLLVALTF